MRPKDTIKAFKDFAYKAAIEYHFNPESAWIDILSANPKRTRISITYFDDDGNQHKIYQVFSKDAVGNKIKE